MIVSLQRSSFSCHQSGQRGSFLLPHDPNKYFFLLFNYFQSFCVFSQIYDYINYFLYKV
jgi:hypothetical protein